MSDVGLVICERRNRWAVALRRSLAESSLRVVETRTLDDCRREAERAPWAVVVCEISQENAEAVLRFLVESQVDANSPPVVVVGQRELRESEAAFRTAGAVHAVFTARELGGVARMVLRQAEQRPEQDASSLAEWAWSQLPWGS